MIQWKGVIDRNVTATDVNEDLTLTSMFFNFLSFSSKLAQNVLKYQLCLRVINYIFCTDLQTIYCYSITRLQCFGENCFTVLF